jgi:hypothetical protein
VESFVIIGVIELLRRLGFRIAVQTFVSAVIICGLHAAEYTFLAFAVAPVFLIQAGTYIYWRRVSFWVGTQMIIALHVLYNCQPALIVLMERLQRDG